MIRYKTKDSGRAPSGQALAVPATPASAVDPSRITEKQRIARVIAPETWRCLDVWDDAPAGIREAAKASLLKAEVVLRMIGNPVHLKTLMRLRTYIDGALGSSLSLVGFRGVLASWADEIDRAIAMEAATAGETPQSGSTEGDSAGRNAASPNTSSSSPGDTND